MNIDLKEMLSFYEDKSMSGIIITDKNKTLNDREARAFIKYCISKGYEELYDCPEFEEVEDELKQ